MMTEHEAWMTTTVWALMVSLDLVAAQALMVNPLGAVVARKLAAQTSMVNPLVALVAWKLDGAQIYG